jgi:ethanolamine ammonia-lyase small subunit
VTGTRLPPAPDLFAALRRSTPARIGLGRSGDSLPLSAELDLQEAHARARDAVHGRVDFAAVAAALAPWPVVVVASAAPDRATYLARPDLGRRLEPADAAKLQPGPYDLALVVADGLSAAAIAAHAAPVVSAILAGAPHLKVAPIVLAREARVAIGDGIGERLGARLVAVLIGERPGLSAADSLGIYLTFAPRIGRRDSERNCISNVHSGGLSHEAAAQALLHLARGAVALGRTGVDLKIEAGAAPTPAFGVSDAPSPTGG